MNYSLHDPQIHQFSHCQTGEHDIEKIDVFVDHADYNFRSSLLLFKEHPRYQEIKGIYDEWVKSEMEK